MASISIYIIENGRLESIRTGDIDSVIKAVEAENLDYTLSPPPTTYERWYWYNNQWNDKPSN